MDMMFYLIETSCLTVTMLSFKISFLESLYQMT